MDAIAAVLLRSLRQDIALNIPAGKTADEMIGMVDAIHQRLSEIDAREVVAPSPGDERPLAGFLDGSGS